MKQKDNLKSKQIDRVDIRYHIILLVCPLLLIIFSFELLNPLGNNNFLSITFIFLIYVLGYSLSYYLHQNRLHRLWQHLERVLSINEATYELVKLSNQYHDQQDFLDALLNKSIRSINGAEMGSIVVLDHDTNKLTYESVVGVDQSKLNKVDFHLEDSFQYQLSQGKCDRVVVINDINEIGANKELSQQAQNIFKGACPKPIRSTLSTPIYIDNKLFGMLNLDSSQYEAFNDYDSNLVSVLTQEACNALSLYQKNKQIHKLANFDSLTELFNRQAFEKKLKTWKLKPHLGSFLILIDMDNLKSINDNLGHQAGDTAILSLANALKSNLSDGGLLGRFGGDEFAVIIHGPITQLKQKIARTQKQLAHESGVEFSYGIAKYENNWQLAFKKADSEMYLQKRAKKNARQYKTQDTQKVS
ncbi:GGDEF domain-containing protein [Parashewanella curva]|uniref:diguanylate cyclase n=1 Tax=Parashewanella curva TaxID=2338552 RepID=A0A3L8Q1P4_9GAMM|nr:sensor domain-containing diguanylate cyclase [Parashewanella curva]RLV61515.1 GGDEF domain-containing protein [Parashewanella curva]